MVAVLCADEKMTIDHIHCDQKDLSVHSFLPDWINLPDFEKERNHYNTTVYYAAISCHVSRLLDSVQLADIPPHQLAILHTPSPHSQHYLRYYLFAILLRR